MNLPQRVIFYYYPQIAPESAGDLYESTEIDEILTLRIITLTGVGVRSRDDRIIDRGVASLAMPELSIAIALIDMVSEETRRQSLMQALF